MNITPNSFSDGGEFNTPTAIKEKIKTYSSFEAIDVGAESTAPMNEPIAWETEWERLKPHLHLLKDYPGTLSFDTYHPETMEEVLKFYLEHGFTQSLIWNDVSGKFDIFAREFISIAPHFSYVYCHNLAPTRELSGRHMDYIDPALTLESLKDFFSPFKLPQVIFDPCLGFSKTYEQNWMILENFGKLQEMVGHDQWLLGFSRKSFLKKRSGMTDRNELDAYHQDLLNKIRPTFKVPTWIRTHRPELIAQS